MPFTPWVPVTGTWPWQFFVGAPSGGDDTARINTALASAYTYALNNQGYYELIFEPATYLLSGNTSTGTLGITGKCKAQIPLPITATTAQKVIHVWRGGSDQSALYHWQQTTPQQAGTTLKTTLNASGQFGGIGTEPSVIGGGLPVNGFGAATSVFGNDLIVIDGLMIQTPQNPQICGFDFRGVAEANVPNAATLVNTGAGLISAITFPTNGQQFGLYMPQVNNNDNCNIGLFSAEGQNYGLVASEHTTVQSVRAAYCLGGIVCTGGGGSGTAHGIRVEYASVEACQIGLQFNYDSASPVKVDFRNLDVETGTGSFVNNFFIYDPNNFAVGQVQVTNVSAATPRTATFVGGGIMNGGNNLNVRSLDLPLGHITAPAVPLSATPLVNGSGASAAVTVSGGTVTAITVNGTATGITSGTVMVGSMQTIAVTYSVVPSWQWNLI